MGTTTGTEPKYKRYGELMHAWRNEVKITRAAVSRETGISPDRLASLESGEVKPDWSELELLAKLYSVSVRELLPYENDLDRGIKFQRTKDSRVIEQKREGRLQYTYWHRAMSSTLPNLKPVELLLHLTRREDVVMNRGHFFHQYTQVLRGGRVAFLWEWQGRVHEDIFEEGDSWLIPGFVPHAFYSPDTEELGRIIAITFGQNLAGDARQELTLMGPDNLKRIVTDDADYYPKGNERGGDSGGIFDPSR